MLNIHVSFELVLVEKVGFAEAAVGMHEENIAEIIYVSPFHVLGQLGWWVKFLLLEHASLFLQADIAEHSLMLFL